MWIFVCVVLGCEWFNVLGVWNVVMCEWIDVINKMVVNKEMIRELLWKIDELGLIGEITLVLDNDCYQHNDAVKALASQLGISLFYLFSYSHKMNLKVNVPLVAA